MPFAIAVFIRCFTFLARPPPIHCYLRGLWARSPEILAQETCALIRPRSPSDRGKHQSAGFVFSVAVDNQVLSTLFARRMFPEKPALSEPPANRTTKALSNRLFGKAPILGVSSIEFNVGILIKGLYAVGQFFQGRNCQV